MLQLSQPSETRRHWRIGDDVAVAETVVKRRIPGPAVKKAVRLALSRRCEPWKT